MIRECEKCGHINTESEKKNTNIIRSFQSGYRTSRSNKELEEEKCAKCGGKIVSRLF